MQLDTRHVHLLNRRTSFRVNEKGTPNSILQFEAALKFSAQASQRVKGRSKALAQMSTVASTGPAVLTPPPGWCLSSQQHLPSQRQCQHGCMCNISCTGSNADASSHDLQHQGQKWCRVADSNRRQGMSSRGMGHVKHNGSSTTMMAQSQNCRPRTPSAAGQHACPCSQQWPAQQRWRVHHCACRAGGTAPLAGRLWVSELLPWVPLPATAARWRPVVRPMASSCCCSFI